MTLKASIAIKVAPRPSKCSAEHSQAEPSQAKPSQAEPSQAKPSQAESAKACVCVCCCLLLLLVLLLLLLQCVAKPLNRLAWLLSQCSCLKSLQGTQGTQLDSGQPPAAPSLATMPPRRRIAGRPLEDLSLQAFPTSVAPAFQALHTTLHNAMEAAAEAAGLGTQASLSQ